MPPPSYLLFYYNEDGDSMCEFALREHPMGIDNRVVLGINFLESYLQLYDLKRKALCLKDQTGGKTRSFTVTPFPYAPKVLSRIKWLWAVVLGLTGVAVLATVAVWWFICKPGFINDSSANSF